METKKLIKSNQGQALIEYVLVLFFMLTIGLLMTRGFSDFLTSSFGNFGYVLSKNLSTGVCPTQCYFRRYANSLPER